MLYLTSFPLEVNLERLELKMMKRSKKNELKTALPSLLTALSRLLPCKNPRVPVHCPNPPINPYRVSFQTLDPVFFRPVFSPKKNIKHISRNSFIKRIVEFAWRKSFSRGCGLSRYCSLYHVMKPSNLGWWNSQRTSALQSSHKTTAFPPLYSQWDTAISRFNFQKLFRCLDSGPFNSRIYGLSSYPYNFKISRTFPYRVQLTPYTSRIV